MPAFQTGATGARSRGVAHRPSMAAPRGPAGYPQLSMRPLYILAFLLPILLLYEAGSIRFLADAAHGTIETIRAQSILLGFFQGAGAAGRFLPAAAIIVVLLLWHAMNRDPWRVNPLVLAAMVIESLLWTIALVVVLIVVQEVFRRTGAEPLVQVGSGDPQALGRPALITISLGAGLYEELLFRMLGIALLHVIFVDLARMSERWGTGLAIALSAAAFAVYHDITSPMGDLLMAKAFSLLVAGVYFGLVYVNRGFGIVVAVHALYDIIVLVVLPGRG